MASKKKKAYQLMKEVKPVEIPYNVWRMFDQVTKEVHFANEQVSLGGDYCTLEEVREAIEWYVDQFNGKVKWND